MHLYFYYQPYVLSSSLSLVTKHFLCLCILFFFFIYCISFVNVLPISDSRAVSITTIPGLSHPSTSESFIYSANILNHDVLFPANISFSTLPEKLIIQLDTTLSPLSTLSQSFVAVLERNSQFPNPDFLLDSSEFINSKLNAMRENLCFYSGYLGTFPQSSITLNICYGIHGTVSLGPFSHFTIQSIDSKTSAFPSSQSQFVFSSLSFIPFALPYLRFAKYYNSSNSLLTNVSLVHSLHPSVASVPLLSIVEIAFHFHYLWTKASWPIHLSLLQNQASFSSLVGLRLIKNVPSMVIFQDSQGQHLKFPLLLPSYPLGHPFSTVNVPWRVLWKLKNWFYSVVSSWTSFFHGLYDSNPITLVRFPSTSLNQVVPYLFPRKVSETESESKPKMKKGKKKKTTRISPKATEDDTAVEEPDTSEQQKETKKKEPANGMSEESKAKMEQVIALLTNIVQESLKGENGMEKLTQVFAELAQSLKKMNPTSSGSETSVPNTENGSEGTSDTSAQDETSEGGKKMEKGGKSGVKTNSKKKSSSSQNQEALMSTEESSGEIQHSPSAMYAPPPIPENTYQGVGSAVPMQALPNPSYPTMAMAAPPPRPPSLTPSNVPIMNESENIRPIYPSQNPPPLPVNTYPNNMENNNNAEEFNPAPLMNLASNAISMLGQASSRPNQGGKGPSPGFGGMLSGLSNLFSGMPPSSSSTPRPNVSANEGQGGLVGGGGGGGLNGLGSMLGGLLGSSNSGNSGFGNILGGLGSLLGGSGGFGGE